MNNFYVFVIACLCFFSTLGTAQSLETDVVRGRYLFLNDVEMELPSHEQTQSTPQSSQVSGMFMPDTVAPVFTVLPSDTIVECDACNSFTVFNAWLDNHGGAQAMDIVSDVTWDYYVAGSTSDCINIRRDSVGFIASDSSGNADTAFALFIVVDTEPPLFNVAVQKLTSDTLISSTATWQPEMAQFDTTLGRLLEVEIKAVNRYRRRVALENTEASSVVMTDTLNSYLLYTISPPGFTYEAAIGSAINADTNLYNSIADYGAFDGTIDFAGVSGRDTGLDTIPFFASCDGLAGINGGDLSPFIGSGMVDLWFIGKAKALATGSGNFVAQFISQHMLDVDVTYTYLVADAPSDTTIICRSALPDPVTIPAYDLCQDITYQVMSKDSLVASDSLCPNTMTIIRSWTAVDACGNDSVLTQTINIIDTVPPLLVGNLPNDTVISCFDQLPPVTAMQAVDNCLDSLAALPQDSVVLADSMCLNQQTILRIWRFDDSCGNYMNYIQTIAIIDTVPPTIVSNLPPDITLTCLADLPDPDSLVAIDGCNGTISVFPVDTMQDVTCANRFTMYRTWTFSDTCLNETNYTQTITVFDTIIPVIVCPADVMLQCPADTSVLVNGMATATDNCGGNVQITYRDSVISGNCPSEMTIYRIWEAEDTCSLQASCIQLIEVVDDEPPMIQCPANITLQCPADTSVASTGAATAFDSCGQVVISYVDSISSGNCPQEYSIIRTWMAADECGNQVSCMQMIFIVDEEPPALICPPDLTLQCIADTSIDSTGIAVAFDSCGSTTISHTDSIIQGSCPGEFTVRRTWRAQDACFNDTVCVQELSVVDTVPPTLICPAQVTVDCPYDTMVLNTDHITTLDECSDVLLTYQDSVVLGNCPQEFTLYRKWTAMDQCQNAASCFEIIVVIDENPPLLVCPADVTLSCPADTSVSSTGLPSVSDMCGDSTVYYSDSIVAGNCMNEYTIIRIWIAGDACMNLDTCRQRIEVIDETAPTLLCPTDLTLHCPADTSVANTGSVVAIDSCGSVQLFYQDSVVAGNCPQALDIFRIWTAHDACMNETTCIQRIVVIDTIPPQIQCPPALTLNCPADTAVVQQPAAMDACGNVTMTYRDSIVNGTCPQEFTLYRIWTAKDACMNSASCIERIDVIDTMSPFITCPADVIIHCPADTSASTTGQASAIDACSAVNVTYVDSVASGVCPSQFTVYREWTASDGCGNESTCTQQISVVDSLPPVIQCPADMTLHCPADTSAANTGVLVAFDECSGVTIVYQDSVVIGNCPQTFDIFRTWIATDNCMNDSQCVQRITVIDTVPPQMQCPPAVTLTCLDDTTALNVPTATDACGDAVVARRDSIVAGACPQEMTIYRIWTATDACLNRTSCIEIISIVDEDAPMITCPQDMTLDCPADTSVQQTGLAMTQDACGLTQLTYTDSVVAGSCPQEYQLFRIWVAEDACGNDTSCTQVISIIDQDPPDITCPMDITLDCMADTSVQQIGMATALDACGMSSVTYIDSIITGNCIGNYTINRVWRAVDLCSNDTTCTQVLTVIDTIPPIITCPQDMTLQCPTDTSVAITGMATASDGCSSVSLVYVDSIAAGDCPNNFIVHRHWKAADNCGNEIDCMQLIEVIDTMPPVIQCPMDVTLDCPADTSAASTGMPAVIDSCGTVILFHTDEIVQGDCPGNYFISRKWIARDLCENEMQCVQSIVVQDTTPPSLTCPADISVNCLQDTAVATTGIAGGADACQSTIITYEDTLINGSCPIQYQLIRNWTIIDSCGNAQTCEQVITIVDTVAPTILCPVDTTLYCPEDIGQLATLSASGSTTCGDTAIISYFDEIVDGTCAQAYTINRYWIAENTCGLADTCVQVISYVDTTAPVLVLPDDITLDCGADTSSTILGSAMATDSCQLTVSINYSDSILPGNCAGNYDIFRIWTAEDSCGNAAVDTQRIVIIDTIAPIINCMNDLFSDCDTSMFDPINSIVEFINAGGDIDETCCLDSASFSFVDSTIMIGASIVTFRTFLISDCCGNSDSCTQLITLNDSIPPMASCRDTVCYEIGNGTDIVVLTVDSIDAGSNDNCFIDTMFLSADTLGCDDESDVQYYSVTLYVVDGFGNIDSCSTVVKITCVLHYDLALKNTVADEVYQPADTIPMTVTIYNQSMSDVIVDTVAVMHYIPQGLSLADPNWMAGTIGASGQSAIRLLATNNGLPNGGLMPGDSISTIINLVAEPNIPRCVYVDYAEIVHAVAIDGTIIDGLDVDSPYDMDDTNDAGGAAATAADNEIFGDGTGIPGDGNPFTDEDDHDPAQICIVPHIAIFGPENPCPGEEATYYFTGFETCQTYRWNLNGGGSILSRTDSTITVRWFDLPGETIEIRLTADNGISGCRVTAFLNVTIQDDVPLVCNDDVFISLDQDCEFVFTADIGLEAPPYNDDAYEIELLDQYGEVIPNGIITHEHVGQQITYIIRSRCYERSCWGYATIEDKVKPYFTCRRDTVGCDADYSIDALGLPDSAILISQVNEDTFIVDGLDNCDEVILTYVDEEVVYDCVTSIFNKLIIRRWTAVDSSGNSFSCADSILFEKITLDSIRLPLDHDGIDLPVLDCAMSWDVGCDLLPNTHDVGEGDGIPQPCEIGDYIASRCNLHVSFVDEIVELCGGSKKIFRKYYIVDHCSGQFVNHTQIILIEDHEPPVVTCPDEVTISTSVNNCAAIASVTRPDAWDACGDVGEWSIDMAVGQIIDFGNGNISISNLPIGRHAITYYVEDQCGNVGSCTSTITVEDHIAPVAVCDVNTQISLDQTGRAVLHAATVDDGSYDNCGVERIDIRRASSSACWDALFRDSIEFCCEDIENSPVEVILRVTDSSGLVNECHAMIVVEDKLPPVIVCPPDISVSCGFAFDLSNLSASFGRVVNRNEGEIPTDIFIDDKDYQQTCEQVIYNGPHHWGQDGYAADNCSLTITENVSTDIMCGVGVISRVFTATDASGNASSCVQRIQMLDCNPFYIVDTDNACVDRQGVHSLMDGVEWPCDYIAVGCAGNETSPQFTGRPEIIIEDAHCGMIADTFYDEVFTIVDDACFKILRHWSVIDWCQMENGLPKRWDYTQVIKVQDDEAPIVSFGEQYCDSLSTSCQSYVTIVPDVVDCTPADMLSYWWRIDLFDDGLGPIAGGFDSEGNTFEAGGEFPIGNHRILWAVEDVCGNRSVTEYFFNIEDCKKPTPVCLALNSVIMPASGQISIPAMAFDASSFDNCDVGLDFRVFAPIMDSMYYVDESINWRRPSSVSSGDEVLSDLPDHIIINCDALLYRDSFEVEIYAIDDAGNWDYCTTWLTIDDNDDICADSLLSIAGRFYTEHGYPLRDVMAELRRASSEGIELSRAVTDSGAYQFITTKGDDWLVHGFIDDDYLNGVTANDLSLIQRHVAGLDYFTSPYQHVAADINMDRSLDIRDVLELRRVLLGIYEEPQSGTAEPWCMVDAAYDFAGLSRTVLPEVVYDKNRRVYDPLVTSDYNADFIGVKMGDVDGDVQLLVDAESRLAHRRMLTYEIDHADDVSLIHFYASDDLSISALQLVLGLTVLSEKELTIIGGVLDEKSLHINGHAMRRNLLPIVYSAALPVSARAGDRLFSISLGGLVDDVGLELHDGLIDHLLFDEKGQRYSIHLHGQEVFTGGFELLQNQPNPMLDQTTIGFVLPTAQAVQLTFYGMDGQVIHTKAINAHAGLNEVIVSRADLRVGVEHVLLYRLTSADYSATKKLLMHID